ncbi:hypothetical protein GALMADRAFT_252530 [Galerina marginata CBS 339.88]|uniref:Uncharacterized protein n=1 Tax=Galerina marginata (strain CBS 339.88) TaxID=685588 RepID=A0A067SSR4_GALM3|nr:hypothetical protein GALMADRAFT_252530 [Galerina marginata CBS 339.88]
MANWIDFVSLIATITVFGGIIYGIIFVVRSINEGWSSTQASLKSKGLDISSSGVSVKTSKRFGREDYVDATQRNIVKAFGASTIRRNDSTGSASGVAPPLERAASSSSTKSTGSEEKKKKRSIFGKK